MTWLTLNSVVPLNEMPPHKLTLSLNFEVHGMSSGRDPRRRQWYKGNSIIELLSRLQKWT